MASVQQTYGTQQKFEGTAQEMNELVYEIKTRNYFSSLPSTTVRCVQKWVTDYDSMFINKKEEEWINNWYTKTIAIQEALNKELRFMIKNM